MDRFLYVRDLRHERVKKLPLTFEKMAKSDLILMLLKSSSFRICQAMSCWKGEDTFGI